MSPKKQLIGEIDDLGSYSPSWQAIMGWKWSQPLVGRSRVWTEVVWDIQPQCLPRLLHWPISFSEVPPPKDSITIRTVPQAHMSVGKFQTASGVWTVQMDTWSETNVPWRSCGLEVNRKPTMSGTQCRAVWCCSVNWSHQETWSFPVSLDSTQLYLATCHSHILSNIWS